MRYRQHSPIVITLPEIYPNEPEALSTLADNGAEIIHLRKPDTKEDDIRNLLQKTDPAIFPNLTLHYDLALAQEFGLGGIHLKPDQIRRITGTFRKSASCHHWEEVKSLTEQADYVFLSPIFDSVSKKGYTAAFTGEQLEVLLSDPDRPVVAALGGITTENIGQVHQWGFEGAAAIGSVWVLKNGEIDIKKSVSNYLELKKVWNETK